MASGGVKVDVTEWRALAEQVKAIGTRAQNLDPVLKGRAQALDTMIKKTFSQQKDPNTSEPWADLKQSTIDAKRKGRGGATNNRKLRESDQMFKSLHARSDNSKIVFGSTGAGDVGDYAMVHQFGTSRAGKKRNVRVEARPFLPLGKGGGKLVPMFVGGDALVWYTRTIDRIRTYITTGKLSGGS